MNRKTAYRTALAVAVVTALALAWVSLGVGVIGADGDPANGMYFGVIAVGILGALVTRFRPGGMAAALFATALAQAVVTAIAVFGGLGRPYSGTLELLGLNGFFIVMFAGSALLFRRAARGAPEATA